MFESQPRSVMDWQTVADEKNDFQFYRKKFKGAADTWLGLLSTRSSSCIPGDTRLTSIYIWLLRKHLVKMFLLTLHVRSLLMSSASRDWVQYRPRSQGVCVIISEAFGLTIKPTATVRQHKAAEPLFKGSGTFPPMILFQLPFNPSYV